MSPAEQAKLQVMIDRSVESAVERVILKVVQPLRDDVDALRRTAETLEKEDRKHSGVHRDLAAGVDAARVAGVEEARRTGEHAKLETTEYIARTLDAFRKEMTEAAQKAPEQMESTKQAVTDAATAITEKADETQDKATKTIRESRRSTAVTLIAMVIIAVLNHYLKG